MIGTVVEVRIEVPRGGFVKPRSDGKIDFRSPLPAPFNYGAVPTRTGGDGDPLDAVVLGARQPIGATVQCTVHAIVRFVDAGQVDDKLICGAHAPTLAQRVTVIGFFRAYARAKSLLNRSRGRTGETRYLGYEGAAP